MTDFIDRTTELKRYFPAPFYKLKPGQGLSIALEIFGEQLNELTVQAQNSREQFILATAVGEYLVNHGINLDVFKPRGYNMSDTTYRELIKIVTNSPKNIEKIFERILLLYFGPLAIENGIANVYSVIPNQIIVEIQANALIIASSRTLYGTWYVHRSNDPFDGPPVPSWTGTIGSNLPIGTTGFTLVSVPVGMPTDGIMNFGGSTSPTETKNFTRVGLVVTFSSPTKKSHVSSEAIEGAINVDDYSSGYIYDERLQNDIVGSRTAGQTSITVSPLTNLSSFPLEGTVYIGNPNNANFEAKGYTRASPTATVFNLKGGLNFAHSSGDSVILPNFNRMIKTISTANILAGSSTPELSVANGADFPLRRGAIKLANSFGNEEIIPFTARKLADNTKLIVDPNYTFRFDHAAGEKVQLMANKTSPSGDGLNWPIYLNDTDSLREQFFALLQRLKATGVKMVFEIL